MAEDTSLSSARSVRTTVTSVLDRFVDAATLSPLKGLGRAALKVMDVYEDVLTNKEECAVLAGRVDEITNNILEVTGQAHELEQDPSLKKDVNELAQTVSAIADAMVRMGDICTSHQVAHSSELAESIRKYGSQLNTAYERFKIQNVLSMRLTLIRLEQNRQKSEESNATPSQIHSKLPRMRVPAKPGNFVGREDALIFIANTLVTEASAHIAILGGGGIGKTAVALSILHDVRIIGKFSSHRYFFPCDATSSATSLATAIGGKLKLSGVQDPTEAVLDYFYSLQCPILIVLDNLESVWDTADQRNVEEFLCGLAGIETVALMVTMRGLQRPSGPKWTLFNPPSPLSLSHAHSLFVQISGKEDHCLDKLLRMLDCWPLAVTLMATIAQSGDSPTYLLSRYEQEKTAMLRSGSDHRLTNVEVSIRVSLECHAMRMDPQAQELLSLVSILPDGVALENLHVLFRNMPACRAAAHTLQRTALARQDDSGTLRVLSPIRLFMLRYYPPKGIHMSDLKEYYIALAARGEEVKKEAKQEVLLILTKEMGNIHAVLNMVLGSHEEKESCIKATLSFASVAYWTVYGSCDSLLRLVFTTLKGLPSLRSQYASCLRELGYSLHLQSYYEEASVMLEEAVAINREIGDRHRRAECMFLLGEALLMKASYSEASSILTEAREMYRQIEDSLGEAKSMLSLAIILRMQELHTEASILLANAMVMFTKIGDRFWETSCMLSSGIMLYSQQRYTEAARILEDARAVFLQIGARRGEADCMRFMGRILIAQNRLPEAKAMIEDALAISEQIGDRWRQERCSDYLARCRKAQSDDI